jgi:hypothetical protein
MPDKFLVGVGKITVDGVETEHPDELTIELSISEFTRRNSGNTGGGNAAKFARIESVRLAFNSGNFDPTTLARALKGETAEAAPAAVNADTAVVSGGVAVIDDLLDTSQAVTVAHNASAWVADSVYAAGSWVFEGGRLYRATVGGTAASSAPTWPTDGSTVVDGEVTWQDEGVFAAVADTDFTVRNNGVYCVAGGGMPDGAPITVSGTRYGHTRVELATAASSQHVVGFEGVNEENGEPMSGLFNRCVFDPSSVALITAEYASVDMAAEVLQDSNVPAGRSGFGTLRMGDATIL